MIPKETDHLEKGKYGPIYPRTPACYGFTIIANVKPGRAETIRDYGPRWRKRLEADPYLLAPLKLHYLRWVLFDNDTRFMYQGIFDTDFDKYTEDAIALFGKAGVNTVFENLEGFPMDWKTNPAAFIKFVRDHQCPSFIEYGEYPLCHRRRDQEGPEDQARLVRDARSVAVRSWGRREAGSVQNCSLGFGLRPRQDDGISVTAGSGRRKK